VNLRGEGLGGSDRSTVVLSAECRSLRRALRPLVWVILEEVALDAVVEDGRLVARTSARQVAERLGIDPGTAAAALGDLRRLGLVTSFREAGPAGRFGLSVYQLGAVAGLAVVSPCAAQPYVASPWMPQPAGTEPAQVIPCLGRPPAKTPLGAAPGVDLPGHWSSSTDAPELASSLDGSVDGRAGTGAAGSARRLSGRAAPGREPVQCPQQGTFDLESESP
jgi:hypothetical protein